MDLSDAALGEMSGNCLLLKFDDRQDTRKDFMLWCRNVSKGIISFFLRHRNYIQLEILIWTLGNESDFWLCSCVLVEYPAIYDRIHGDSPMANGESTGIMDCGDKNVTIFDTPKENKETKVGFETPIFV